MNNKVIDFERECRAEVDAKRDELKVRPPVAIHYNYVGGCLLAVNVVAHALQK